MGIVSSFPASWLVDVIVLRSGGRDSDGDPLPASEMPVKDCLVGPRSTTEASAAGQLTSSEMSLYRDPDAEFRFLSTDQIRVPVGALNSGLWMVDGRIKEFPLGVEVPLKEG